jgi:hypothetical protein
MTDYTNYGTTLGRYDSTSTYPTIGEIVSVDPPEYTQPEVESTNHGSGGVRQYISSMLAEMTPFKATLNAVPADIATLKTDMRAGTSKRYQMGFPNGDKEAFGALVTSVKMLTADAQKPDTLMAEITFRPTDSISLSS